MPRTHNAAPEVAVFRGCELRFGAATLLAAALQTAPDVRPNFGKSRVIIRPIDPRRRFRRDTEGNEP